MLGGSPKELRPRNRASVLREVSKSGSISRTKLALETGLSGTAITRITRELIDSGLLEESEKTPREGVPGRKRTQLTLTSGGPFVIGIGIQATDASLVLANLRGEIWHRLTIPPEVIADFEKRAVEILPLADDLLRKFAIRLEEVAGIGVAVAGAVDPERGFVATAPPLGWSNVPVQSILSRHFDRPISVENLNNALIAAEHRFGVGQDRSNLMLFRISYSVGAAFIVEGNVVRGSSFGAGQVGHMPIDGASDLCSCGAHGCFNTVASGLAVLADYLGEPYHQIAAADAGSNTGKFLKILEDSCAGDDRAQRALFRVGERLGAILKSFTMAFQPELILLSGQVGRNPHFFDGVRSATDAETRDGGLRSDRVAVTSMSVAQGAVSQALSRFVFSENLAIKSMPRMRSAVDSTAPKSMAAGR